MDSSQSTSHGDEEGESDRRRSRTVFYDEEYFDNRVSNPPAISRMARSSSAFLKTKSFPNGNKAYYNSLNLRKKRQNTYTRHLSSEQNLRDLVKKSVLEGKWLCWHEFQNLEGGYSDEATRKHRRKEILQFQLVQFEVAFNMEIADLVNLAKRSVSWNHVDMPKYLKRNIATTVDNIKRNSDFLLHELNCLWKEKHNFSGIYITYQKYMDKYEIYVTYCRDLQKLREMIFERNANRPQVSEVKMSEIFGIERDLLPVFHLGLLCCVLEELKKESTLKQLDQYHCCRTLSQLKKVEDECCKLVSKMTSKHSTAYTFNKELTKKCKLYADRVYHQNKCLSGKCAYDNNGNPSYSSSGERNLHKPLQGSVEPNSKSFTLMRTCKSECDTKGYSENGSTIAVPKSYTKSLQNGYYTSNNSRNNLKLKEISTASNISGNIQLRVTHFNNADISENHRKNLFASLSDSGALLYHNGNQKGTTNRQGAHTMLQTNSDDHRHIKIFGDFVDTHQFYPRYSKIYKKPENFSQNLERVSHTKKFEGGVSAMNCVTKCQSSDTSLDINKSNNGFLQPSINVNEENEISSSHEGQKSVATQTKESSMVISSHLREELYIGHTPVQQQTIMLPNDTDNVSESEKSDSFKLIQALNIILIEDRNSISKHGIKKPYLETRFDCDSLDLVQAVNMPVIKAAMIETTFINPNEICEAINDVTVDYFIAKEDDLQEYDDSSESDSEICENSMSHYYENLSETSNSRQYTYSGGSIEIPSDNECMYTEEHYYENLSAENHGILLKVDHSFTEENAYENCEVSDDFVLRGQSHKSSLSLRKLQKLRESFRSNKRRNLEDEKYNNVEFEELSHYPLYQNFSFSSLPVFVDDGHQFIVDETEPADSVQKEHDETPYEDMTFTMRCKTRLQDGNKLPNRRRHHGFRTRWLETEEVIKSGLLDTMTPQQIKLQEAKFEIITSELSYYKSLCILERMFAENPILKNIQILPHKDREILFSQVKPVKSCSQNFLNDLVTVWERDLRLTKMADTIIHHACEHFGVYVKYCENLQIIEKRLRHLIKNKRFSAALKKIEDEDTCEKFPLYSFLMLPMQRATRFHLLADAVLKYMQTPNEEYERWCNACEALQSLAQDCNSSVKSSDDIKMKKSEETPLKKFFRNRFKMKK